MCSEVEKLRSNIREVHLFYFKEVRPVVIECESLIDAAPDPVHTEIRHAFDHIARVEAGSIQDEKRILNSLNLGQEHFKRAIVDAWELMAAFLSSKIDRIITNLEMSIYYRAFRGHSYRELLESQKEALNLYSQAREIKSDDYNEAREFFQKAYNILKKALEDFFQHSSSEEYLRHRDKVAFILWISGLVISFIAGLGINFILF